jgi:hypothetical protein
MSSPAEALRSEVKQIDHSLRDLFRHGALRIETPGLDGTHLAACTTVSLGGDLTTFVDPQQLDDSVWEAHLQSIQQHAVPMQRLYSLAQRALWIGRRLRLLVAAVSLSVSGAVMVWEALIDQLRWRGVAELFGVASLLTAFLPWLISQVASRWLKWQMGRLLGGTSPADAETEGPT